MRGRPILALVFVVLTALVLTIPLRNTGDEAEPRRASRPQPTAQPTPEEEPTPEDTPTPQPSPTPDATTPPDTARFAGDFPDECLEPVDPPADGGLLAIDQGEVIEISDLTGDGTASVADEFPLEWSPSGRYFMAESGTIYDTSGGEVASLLNEDATSYWGWSPISDCVLTTDGTAMSVFLPGGGRETLHSGAITGFAFSPSGGSLAYLEGDEDSGTAHLWVASLSNGRSNRLTTLELAAGEEVVLGGWTPDARHVLYWQGSAEELLDPGRKLQAVSAGGRIAELPTVLAHRDFVAACDDLLAITGRGSRVQDSPKRLAVLDVGEGSRVLTPEGSQDVSVTCSPTADFLATVRTPEDEGRGPGALTVVDTGGSEVLTADDASFNDAYPLWGRAGAGLLFVRWPLDGDDPVLWHIAEGGAPAPTGITLEGIDAKPGLLRDSWGHWLAWSAAQPSGVHWTSEPD